MYFEYLSEYNKYKVLPPPGPIQTLYNMRHEMRRANDNDKDERLDFLAQKAKQQQWELFDYDTPNLFQVSTV